MATATPIVNHDVEKNAGGEVVEQRTSSEMPLEGAESISDSDTIMQNRRDSDVSSTTTASLGIPPKKSVELAVVEKKPQTVTEEDTPITLPEKHGSKVTRYLFFDFLTAYRKTFAAIFFGNLAAFIALIVQNNGAPPSPSVASATSANLMVTLLFRQENFVNLVYEIFTCAPHSLPLIIRRKFAKVFHYGGFHSGCGVAATVWYLLYTALVTKEFVESKSSDTTASVATSWILLAMFFTIVAGAHPKFRVRFHDRFEAMHRFAGWIALITFWIHMFLAAVAARKAAHVTLGHYLAHSPNFWFLLVSACCTALSWGRLRQHEVFPEVLSDHATRLHFRYQSLRPFYGIKLSDRPLFEWHAFATIPDDDGKGFSVVVSNAGDWTKRHILHPPTKLWIRGYPLHGLLYTSKLFKRIVVVATGSGIGPCLSLLFADITPRRVLWSTPNPESTYGPVVMGSVLKADPEALIWNTRSRGRPDMVALTYQLYREFDAEAVFVISNPKVTRKVVYGMETRGVAAYGAIFDS